MALLLLLTGETRVVGTWVTRAHHREQRGGHSPGTHGPRSVRLSPASQSDMTRLLSGFRPASWMEKNKGFNPILQEVRERKFFPSR